MATFVPPEDIPEDAEAYSYAILRDHENETPERPIQFLIEKIQFHKSIRGGKLGYQRRIKEYPGAAQVGWAAIGGRARRYGVVI